MSARALVLGLLALAPAARAQENCALCHGELGVSEARRVHARNGVRCIDCHGGNPTGVESAAAHGADLHVPAGPRAAVELCGSCHADPDRMRGFGIRTDQLLEYRTSAHGLRLAEADDPDVATCVSCHGSHGILSADDPRSSVHPLRQVETCARCHADAALMGRHELPADPPALYRDSVHGRALLEGGIPSSPACADCHGAHGATPPHVEEVGRVCGRCHASVLERFEQSPHRAAAREGLLEECVSCHGNHAVERPSSAMLVGGEPGDCGSCHARDPEAIALGATLERALSDYEALLSAAAEALRRAEARGLFVEHEGRWLAEARALRGQAGALVHELSPQALDDVFEPGRGMIAEALSGLEHKERELSDRRLLVLVFFGVVLLLAATLLVLAREVAGRAAEPPGGARRA